jgi:hypothetical protein
MRPLNFKSVLAKSALAASFLVLANSAALAQTVVNLTAKGTTAVMPDGSAVPMWGLFCTGAGTLGTCAGLNPAAVTAGTWTPPVITVPLATSGPTSLTINLTNNLAFTPASATTANNIPTSLVIVGQLGGGLGGGGTTTPSPDHTNAQQVTWPIVTGGTGTPPSQLNRVQSFGTEVAVGTTATTLTWPNLKPGTYLIESGTHPSIQGPMGLYGILVVTAAPSAASPTGCAYPTAAAPSCVTTTSTLTPAAYNAEVPLIFSEIDPAQNGAVSVAVNTAGFSETMVWSGLAGGCGNPASPTYNQCYPPAVNYTPLYYLINGVGFDTSNANKSLFAATPGTGTAPVTGTVLVRMVNAGLRMHVPAIVGSQTGAAVSPALPPAGFALIAEDGNPLPGVPRVQSEVFMAAGKTYDVAINVPASTAAALPIFDRQLSLSGNATQRNAGMLAYIGVNGAALPVAAGTGMFAAAAAVADSYPALTAGVTLAVSDPAKGVIANDKNVYGVTLLTPATSGTVTLNKNGTFTYVPNAGSTATSDSFAYCANTSPATIASTGCPANLTATVTLAKSNISDTAGVTCTAVPTFNAKVSSTLSVRTPGVLAGCSDGASLPLTVAGAPTTTPIAMAGPGTGTVVIESNGGFTATASAPGIYTFSFQAQNSLKAVSSATTVTVVFPAGSGLVVNVVDGADHTTAITDYRWIIEEDRTFYIDPKCTSNPLPATCQTISGVSGPANYGMNFHTSFMPVVASGCTGALSCEVGQTMQGAPVVCDVGNGTCRPDPTKSGMAASLPSQVVLDPTKRFYISIMPGDASNPFIGANLSAPTNCANGPYVTDPVTHAPVINPATGLPTLNTGCGHGMGGAPIPVACTPVPPSKTCTGTFAPVMVQTVPTPLPTATLSVIAYEDDYPLNGEQGPGGGVDVLAPNEPGLGGFQVTIFDQAGQTGDATGQPTYDMFNQPLSNALAGTVDPVTGLDACPVSNVVTNNVLTGDGSQKGQVGMIVTCPKYESDGKTLSPMVGQALVKNLYPGRYGIAALPGADRIALGEEWVQTNTLDGQKQHDSFMRVGEPAYFQEFGPAGYHVSIGFANPKLINERRYNSTKSGMCDTTPSTSPLACVWEIKGQVTGSRLTRSPDQRLFASGSRASLAFTQCYASLGDPDGAELALVKCDADGNFDFKNIPPGNWSIKLFDQWNDQIIDGIYQGVGVGCAATTGGLCDAKSVGTSAVKTCTGPTTTGTTCDMGEIGVHQWQADIYTRTFIDTANTGVSDSTKPGLALAATNIRFRDGSFSNYNNTDLNGFASYNEVFPLFNWYTIETDTTRYKPTGTHVIYDAGGPADGSGHCDPANGSPCGASTIAAGLANTYEKYPLPADLSVPGAVYCATADCTGVGESIALGPKPSSTSNHSTGRIDPPFWFGSWGWQGFIGQGNFLEFGVKPFVPGETGPIHGHVVYASTRPFDNPQLLAQMHWEPLVPHVRVNLYKEGVASDGVTQTLTLIDHTDTSSWDDWAQGFRSDGKPNMNCPGQSGLDASGNPIDPFYYALKNQPEYLDYYNNVLHGTATTPTGLPYNAQYKCYDGNHMWNQLQPAPYDGMYSFPSVTGLDPTSGKPTGSNCTACVPNPDANDPYRHGAPMLPPGKYVVEVVVPPGYELVKEEDKNILIGDNFIAPAVVQFPGLAGSVYILPDQAALAASYNATNPQNSTSDLGRIPTLVSHEGDTGSVETYWPCVGTVRQVPDFISLFPQSAEVAPFAGAMRPLCDRKEITLNEQSAALAKFYIFSSTHVTSHFQGIILDDFTAEFDPFSPQFGEKFAPSYLPVGVKDWTGNEVNRVYSDQFGLYNGLNYSTWEVNPPNPTGYSPTMMVMCMNDAGKGVTPDALFQPGYSQFCYELPFMPGQTGYFDTPVVPVQSFSEGYNHPDCAYPDATPAIASVTGSDGIAGPWVKAAGTGHTLTVTALGDQSVDWYGYTGPSMTTAPWNQQKITRHYGFGTTPGTVTIGGVPATVAWGDASLTVTVPAGVPNCAVQQQKLYAGATATTAQCGQLVITTAAGKQSIDSVTVTIGGSQPKVLQAGQTIQSAIDAANPGDMIIVPSGFYNEMLVMWKPVRLQGVGASAAIIDANTQPAGKLLNPWRQKVVCLFGLTQDGRPRSPTDTSCDTGLNGATNAEPSANWTNFPTMVVDRLPFEATLGWDATLNGNLAEQMIEPSLLGAYEGAVITVMGKGVKFPKGTLVGDAFGATTGAAFPTNTTLLQPSDCFAGRRNQTESGAYPTNFYCNPSSVDGLGIRDSSQGGGGIFVHAYAHNLQIANNRVHNNTGTMSGGISVGAGEHPDVALGGAGQTILSYPTSCETSNIQNLGLPFCFNMNVNIHNNAVVGNSSMGDELFSSTPAGAGGVSINTGSDYYKFTNNWICGNVSTGDGAGFAHIGFTKNGDVEHNTIIFNQTTNPSITTNGGGLLVMGAPDADPTTCGVTTDQDCLPPPGTVTPSDGSGPGLMINANLILGNAADSGSGGGLRLQHINGTDVLNIPNGRNACPADLTNCHWNSVNVTNNIIVNNVAGWDGAGVSLLDALAVNIVNNTIASNDATASSGDLFQSLFAPLASTVAPTSNVTCGATNGRSCPQIAGLVSVSNSPVLSANIDQLPANTPLRCPRDHGTVPAGNPASSAVACYSYSIPLMFNDAIWENRSFYIGVGNLGSAANNQNQQKVVTLYNAAFAAGVSTDGTAAGNQASTGACPASPTYWEMGFRGDTAPANNSASGFAAATSILTAATYGGTGNLTSDPAFTHQYCNGSRTPPEAGFGAGWAVPPGTNETNAFPNPVFSLTPSAVVDEGNNWVNLRWGPLSLTTVGTVGPAYDGTVLANYAPLATSPAIGAGAASLDTVPHPSYDFFDTKRPNGKDTIGAIEVAATASANLSVTGGPLAFGNVAVGVPSAAQTLTLHNTGTAAGTGITLAFAPTVFSRAGGTCTATLAAGTNCTITVVFTPTATGAANGTLTITANVAVTGSPVALSGTGVASVRSATLTPATGATLSHARNCPGTGFGVLACALDPVQAFTLTNTGNVPLTGIAQGVLGGLATNDANWAIVRLLSTCGPATGGQMLGDVTLAPGATCNIEVQFKPLTAQAAGAKPATVSVTDAAGTQTSTLNGTAQ